MGHLLFNMLRINKNETSPLNLPLQSLYAKHGMKATKITKFCTLKPVSAMGETEQDEENQGPLGEMVMEGMEISNCKFKKYFKM